MKRRNLRWRKRREVEEEEDDEDWREREGTNDERSK